MANTLTDIIPTILATGLLALRSRASMPRLVNGDYSTEAAEKGDTIDVTLPVAQVASNVTPGPVPPTPADSTPTKVPIALDQWKKTNFHLTDKEILEIRKDRNFMPGQVSEAAEALAVVINQYIFSKYVGVYGYQGTAATTPFGSGVGVSDATGLRATLNEQKCPKTMRRAVLDWDAEAAALDLSAFSDAEKTADDGAVKIEGEIGRKYGIDWFADDDVPSHTAGTASGATTDATGYAIGLKTVTLASAGTGTILVGDVITFAGQTQTYVITSGDADVSGGGTISFEPGLKVAIPAGATAITLKATHVVNLGFHRNAFALAVRPLANSTAETTPGASEIMTMQDPVSGLPLRVEVTRQYKQTMWEFDILYGAALVRPELAARLAG
jgi:hypothetical protein